jgi:hypothetical protein
MIPPGMMMPMKNPPAHTTPAVKARQWNEMPPNQMPLSPMPSYSQSYPPTQANQGRQQEALQTAPERKVSIESLEEPAYNTPQQSFGYSPYYGKPDSSCLFEGYYH